MAIVELKLIFHAAFLPKMSRGYSSEQINFLINNRQWKELVRIGEPAVLPLIEGLRTAKISSLRFIASTLGEIGDPRAIETLIHFLHMGHYYLRSSAIISLGKIGNPLAVEPLIKKLKSYNIKLRREAALALGAIGDPTAVEPLIELLTHSDKYLRRNAANALVRINDPRSAFPLVGYILTLHPFFWEGQRNKIVKFFRLNELQSRWIIMRDNYNWKQ